MAGALEKSGSVETEARASHKQDHKFKKRRKTHKMGTRSKFTKLILEGLYGDAFRTKGAPGQGGQPTIPPGLLRAQLQLKLQSK
eukprot:scaffold11441_cov99-Skeletonema_dohrnii-CCMP3373.AAC.3